MAVHDVSTAGAAEAVFARGRGDLRVDRRQRGGEFAAVDG